ncbi:hypothetical protein B0A49_00062 [Cryomyces minteri]|uniref:Transcription factor domain-containing protein n=1 Tax=Cryomyces minteri TaxID=331657 RepID=A0A4U0XWZ5_9PEZI|nr:hypothetical protein B0A49_00062 [Cryomyces minteri]
MAATSGPPDKFQPFRNSSLPISSDSSSFGIDQYLQLAAYDHDTDYQFFNGENMQQVPLDFGFPDLSNFMSPSVSMFCSPTIDYASLTSKPLPKEMDTSRPPSPSSSSNHSTFSSDRRPVYTLASSEEVWACCRCNPSSEAARLDPKTGRIYLEGLEYTLKNHDAWQSFKMQVNNPSGTNTPPFTVVVEPFSGSARVKLVVVTQSFVNKAREVHGSGSANPPLRNHSRRNSGSGYAGFIILPPSNTLEHFLRAYASRFEPYYTTFPAGRFSPTELMETKSEKPPSLLLLLMIAQGAMAAPHVEARYLTSGLIEACRISLFDILEKDVMLSVEPVVLRSALMYVNLACWSGDKWHMDLATSQRGMYISMLRHSGLLKYQKMDLPSFDGTIDIGAAWQKWRELVYSWVTVDQELSLFHDCPPKLGIGDLHTAIPDLDMLWRATTAEEWSRGFEEVYGSTQPVIQNPPSLSDLFRRFMNGQSCEPSCFFDGGNHRQAQRLISQLEEAQNLLQQWYALSSRSEQKHNVFSPVTCANLVIYHLISLNTVTCFPELERLARGEVTHETFRQSFWARARCVEEAAQIWFHCGQVIRLVRLMPEQNKPPWWAAAVYRVALIMWATSIANNKTQTPSSHKPIPPLDENNFAIDGLMPEDTSIVRYLRYKEGVPMLSKRDGTMVSLTASQDVLGHCLDVLNEEESTMRMTEGIEARLARMFERWRA